MFKDITPSLQDELKKNGIQEALFCRGFDNGSSHVRASLLSRR